MIEQAFALLLGPVLSFACAGFVLGTLSGVNTGWSPQARGERRVTIVEAARRHGIEMLVGSLLLAVAVRGGGWFAIWMLPTAAGLVMSPCITALASRRDLGQWSRRLGLFATQDDVSTAVELRELRDEM